MVNVVLIVLAALALGCAYAFGMYPVQRPELETDAELRKRKAEYLRNPKFANIYGRWLTAVLHALSGFFGKRYFSIRAIGACIGISLVYSSVLFLLGWAFGGSTKIGATEFVGVNWDWPLRVLVFSGLIATGAALYLIGINTARIDRAFKNKLAKLLSPLSESGVVTVYRLILGIIAGVLISAAFSFVLDTFAAVAFAGAVAFAIVSTVVGAGAGLGAGPVVIIITVSVAVVTSIDFVVGGVGAIGLAVGFAGAIAFAGAEFAICFAIIGAGAVAIAIVRAMVDVAYVAFAGDFSKFIVPPNVSSLLFLLLLPVLNGILDALSWWVSRRLGRHLLETFKKKVSAVRRTVIFLWHILADLVAALCLLALLAMLLTATVEGTNMLADANGLPPPLLLGKFLDDAKNDPWGGDGIWITLMLLSTLVPTLGHFVMVVAGSGLRLWPETYRERLADGLDRKKPMEFALRGAAWHSTLNWVASGLIVLTAGGLLLWGISAIWSPVSDILYWLAQETLTQIGGPSAPSP